MKYLWLFLLFFVSTFAQSWQNEISLFNIPSYSKINSCVTSRGVHLIYSHNGGVKYALTRPNGSVIKQDIVIENEGAGCSMPAIASINNDVYSFYVKNNCIYMAKSSNLGDTWIINSSYYSLPTSTCDTLIALPDNNNINIVWSGKGSDYHKCINYIQFNYVNQPNWNYYKKVTDAEIGDCDMPSMTLSQYRIHIGYRHTPIAKTRDIIRQTQTWDNPQIVSDVIDCIAIYQNIFSINNQLHAVVKYRYTGMNGGPHSWFAHYIRGTDNLTWQFTGSLVTAADNYDQTSAVSANNKIHLIYFDSGTNLWTHRTFDNGDWSSPIATNICLNFSNTLNAVGNDLYLTSNINEVVPSAIHLRHFNDAPVIPLSFAISSSPASHPYLTWGNNDPEVYYNSSNGFVLERRLGTNTNPPIWGSWSAFTGINGTINCYEDLTINNATGAGQNIAEYKLRANDNSNYSPYTNSLDIRYGTGSEKIIGSNNLSSDSYKLFQNFPNPFNPSTEIYYQIPTDGNVKLKVYNMLGQEIMTIVNGFKEKGMYSATFNAGNLVSGIYIYKLEAGNFTQVKKMLLTK